MVHGRALTEQVAARLCDETPVALGMRYGEPSLESAVRSLYDRGVRRIRLLPLYPQFAASTTGAILEEVYRVAGTLWDPPHIEALLPYYDHPAFVAAWAAVARPVLEEARPDFVLFSYHGLPERQIRRSDPTGRCLTDGCCDGDDHREVALARRRLRTLLDELHEELRATRDGTAWLMGCIARFREEGATAVWPPYPGTEEIAAEEDVDGM